MCLVELTRSRSFETSPTRIIRKLFLTHSFLLSTYKKSSRKQSTLYKLFIYSHVSISIVNVLMSLNRNMQNRKKSAKLKKNWSLSYFNPLGKKNIGKICDRYKNFLKAFYSLSFRSISWLILERRVTGLLLTILE